MPRPRLRDATPDLSAGFAAIRAEQDVPEAFPPEVTAEAARLAADGPPAVERADRRDIELSSIDPAGSRDLDQAFHLAPLGSGFRIHYAIADVGGWVPPGGPIDVESRERGTTIYCPDVRIPLHPTALSEEAASLLPDVDRPAVLWTIDLDQRGAVADVAVERALVRNRRALDYVGAQAHLDGGGTDEQLRLLAEIGDLRLADERARGGVSLTLPEQSVVRDGDRYRLEFETTLDTERWNAQLSLCTGIVAARLMIDHGVGVLRTLPAAPTSTIDELRAAAAQVGSAWPSDTTYPEWVRSLDPGSPRDVALMIAASRTLRGAGYVAFDGAGTPLPDPPPEHAAIAAPYAHVTAPLRRLVDRFGTECALASVAGARPPAWVLDALPTLADDMQRAGNRAGTVDRACIDLVEAALLAHRVGDLIDGVVSSLRRDGEATVQLADPAVIANASVTGGEVRPGDAVAVRVVAADPASRKLELEAAPAATP